MAVYVYCTSAQARGGINYVQLEIRGFVQTNYSSKRGSGLIQHKKFLSKAVRKLKIELLFYDCLIRFPTMKWNGQQ